MNTSGGLAMRRGPLSLTPPPWGAGESIGYERFVQPVAVLAAIPFSLVGVVWGHVALGLQLSMPSLVGLATLCGVVVNDSILIVSFLRERLENGAPIL